jgi:hypothetical protein
MPSFLSVLEGRKSGSGIQGNIWLQLDHREKLLIKGQSIRLSTPAVAFNQRMRLLRFVALTVTIVSAQQ